MNDEFSPFQIHRLTLFYNSPYRDLQGIDPLSGGIKKLLTPLSGV